ncbi:phosphatase [Anaerosacchariphilus polymeriproducens]|uniref:Phosphatase n=1 Tax=Anaerosacchariphilus polymeriproducens TaxID=1812858 RepID=A0A371AWF4_9FIRM|nr:phosphatase [Anaerosacchariphilus polymeriproducens]RDU23862.1 phosphatase [Anaerosacchariphilus polymeriproducens]
MNYVLDTHSHTIVSGHAYNTINEMAMAASEKKLELLAITEHAPSMPGSCQEIYFRNLKVLERNKYGVELLFGAELNIIDKWGRVDLPNHVLEKLDIGIASLHPPCIKPGTMEENTAAYVNVMKNPYIDIIGHPDDDRFPIDYKILVETAKEQNVLLEVNNSSIGHTDRKGAKEHILQMLKLCKEKNVSVVIGSDAHADTSVGNHGAAFALMKEVEFPEELVVNRSVNVLKSFLHKF